MRVRLNDDMLYLASIYIRIKYNENLLIQASTEVAWQ